MPRLFINSLLRLLLNSFPWLDVIILLNPILIRICYNCRSLHLMIVIATKNYSYIAVCMCVCVCTLKRAVSTIADLSGKGTACMHILSEVNHYVVRINWFPFSEVLLDE